MVQLFCFKGDKMQRDELKRCFFGCFEKVNEFGSFDQLNQSKIVSVLMNYLDYASHFQEITSVGQVNRSNNGGYEITLGGMSEDYSRSIEVRLCFQHRYNEDRVKVSAYKAVCENGQNKWTWDGFTLYKDRVFGSLVSYGKDNKPVTTLFKEDIIIPNKNNTKELYWLQSDDVCDIFSIGLAEHLKHTSNPYFSVLTRGL